MSSIIINKESLSKEDYDFIVKKLEQYNINDVDELEELIENLWDQSWNSHNNSCDELMEMSLVYILISEDNVCSNLNCLITTEIAQEEFEQVEDYGRWDLYMRTVVSIDNRFFEIYWSRGATEYQENDWCDSYFTEVKPVKKEIVVYEPIKDEN